MKKTNIFIMLVLMTALVFTGCSDGKTVANTADLDATIAQAETLNADTGVGTAVGEVSQDSKDTFTAAIEAAKAVSEDANSTQDDIDAATAALLAAMGAFTSSVNLVEMFDLVVTVTNTAGFEVYDATVTVGDVSGDTDAAGVVTLSVPGSATHDIVTTKAGYTDGADSVVMLVADNTAAVVLTPSLPLEITMGAGTATIATMDWESGSTLTAATIDGYTAIQATPGDGWGASTACVALVDIGDYTTDYTSITLTAKLTGATDNTQIAVKVPEVELFYTLADGTAEANGWYTITVPFADFTGDGGFVAGTNQIGIHGGWSNGGTLAIADVVFN